MVTMFAEDVAVTGFDGIEEALDFYPPITTVRYDIDATISRTFRIMRNLLQGKEIDEPLADCFGDCLWFLLWLPKQQAEFHDKI